MDYSREDRVCQGLFLVRSVVDTKRRGLPPLFRKRPVLLFSAADDTIIYTNT
jgi:hypothetical protein